MPIPEMDVDWRDRRKGKPFKIHDPELRREAELSARRQRSRRYRRRFKERQLAALPRCQHHCRCSNEALGSDICGFCKEGLCD